MTSTIAETPAWPGPYSAAARALASSAEVNVHAPWSRHDEVRPGRAHADQPQAGMASQQRADRHLAFQPLQPRTKTGMNAESQRDVTRAVLAGGAGRPGSGEPFLAV